jgi:hypothetical protein
MKVWATGCSWTYGTGLSIPVNEMYHSIMIQHIIKDEYNWKYNYSDAGHSNQYIFRTAIEIAEKMNKEEDVLLVQWSSPFRQEMITTEGYALHAPYDFVSTKFLYGRQNELYETIGPKNIHIDEFRKIGETKYKDIIIKMGKLFMNDTYMELMSYNMQISLHHLLKSLGVKSIQFYGWEECKIKSKNIWDTIPDDGTFLKESFESVLNDNGFYLIGSVHPNKEMHKLFGKFLINKLEKLNYITAIKNNLI